jgi:hypothetical protein
MGTVEIERKKLAFADNARKYKIVIDGDQRGTIGRGETVRHEVGPGAHTVKLTINWCSSEQLSIDVADGETVRLRCEPRANGITALWYVSFGRARWIRLALARG